MASEPERRVRVVEGNEDSRDTLAIALKLAGCEVETFASPTEASAVAGGPASTRG